MISTKAKYKITILAFIAVIILISCIFALYKLQHHTIQQDVLDYLARHYVGVFIIDSPVEESELGEGVEYAFYVYPEDRNHIRFVVGKIKTDNPFSFMPFMDSYTFFDDYSERVEAHDIENGF